MNNCPRVVVVTGRHCPACLKQKQHLEKEGIEFEEIESESVYGRIVCSLYKVMGLPTVMIRKEGGRPDDKMATSFRAGFVTADMIRKEINKEDKWK